MEAMVAMHQDKGGEMGQSAGGVTVSGTFQVATVVPALPGTQRP